MSRLVEVLLLLRDQAGLLTAEVTYDRVSFVGENILTAGLGLVEQRYATVCFLDLLDR